MDENCVTQVIKIDTYIGDFIFFPSTGDEFPRTSSLPCKTAVSLIS